jgi:hypothetical protein
MDSNSRREEEAWRARMDSNSRNIAQENVLF